MTSDIPATREIGPVTVPPIYKKRQCILIRFLVFVVTSWRKATVLSRHERKEKDTWQAMLMGTDIIEVVADCKPWDKYINFEQIDEKIKEEISFKNKEKEEKVHA